MKSLLTLDLLRFCLYCAQTHRRCHRFRRTLAEDLAVWVLFDIQLKLEGESA